MVGLAVACFPDTDHLYSYVKHGYFKNWKRFYKNAFGEHDAYRDQRNILHNIIVAGTICGIGFSIVPELAVTITLAYASHLMLDAIDKSDYYPLYPLRGINMRGFIDFYSWQEGIVFVGLAACYLVLRFV